MLNQALYADNRNQAFYTEAPDIAQLMADLLEDVSGKTVLEPAVGRGAFLGYLKGTPSKVDAVEVDDVALAHTKQEFGDRVNPIHGDFIELALGKDLFRTSLRADYDAVISNPPYGLRFTKEYRKYLKEKLGNFYVRESYGLFLKLSLERLKSGGRYVFIIPDTFLTSANHTPLRHFLANKCPPSHIVLFSSKRFGSVQFGYGSFCVIAGNRDVQPEATLWADLRKDAAATLATHAIEWQSEMLTELRKSEGWVPPSSRQTAHTFPNILGDIAECRTGIYTGDNDRFLGFDPVRLKRRANGHPIKWDEEVTAPLSHHENLLVGLESRPFYVPLIRGGHREPFEDTFWAIRWDKDSIKHYNADKKARFQNSRFYFKEGIALPMVTSGRITASYMNNSVFDQGVVGVFPKSSEDIEFLLFYLNSTFASKILKGEINPSANNSAKYISRIPVPVIDKKARAFFAERAHLLKIADKEKRQEAIDAVITIFLTNQNIS